MFFEGKRLRESENIFLKEATFRKNQESRKMRNVFRVIKFILIFIF